MHGKEKANVILKQEVLWVGTYGENVVRFCSLTADFISILQIQAKKEIQDKKYIIQLCALCHNRMSFCYVHSH